MSTTLMTDFKRGTWEIALSPPPNTTPHVPLGGPFMNAVTSRKVRELYSVQRSAVLYVPCSRNVPKWYYFNVKLLTSVNHTASL
jgi:hypothetical protein